MFRPVDGRGLKFTLVFVTALYVVHALELLLSPGLSWAWLGILPRTFSGLSGIFLAPVLHGTWGHLLVNTGPLMVLLALPSPRLELDETRMAPLATVTGPENPELFAVNANTPFPPLVSAVDPDKAPLIVRT